MIDQYFPDAAVLKRLKESSLSVHLNSFAELVSGLGYAEFTIRWQCVYIGRLGAWLKSNGLDASDLNDDAIDGYLARCYGTA